MAASLRISTNPLLSTSRASQVPSPFLLPSAYLVPSTTSRRQFSQAPQCKAKLGARVNVRPRSAAGQGMRSRMKDTGLKNLIPTDLGLLPGTFIRPVWTNLPSIFSQPRERLHMEWVWLKMTFANFIGVLSYNKFFNKGMPMRFRERRKVAKELHQKMYKAFADGDTLQLRELCCSGLAEQFAGRINARPLQSSKLTWTLHNYLRNLRTPLCPVKVVSDRATQIPMLPDSGIRQTVVRIHSRQSLAKADAADAADKQKDCIEYLVLQRMMVDGKDGNWQVWGLAEETTVADLQQPLFQAGLTMGERLSMMKDSVSK